MSERLWQCIIRRAHGGHAAQAASQMSSACQGGAAAEDLRAREWALVRALAELRGAPAEPAYLAALARAGAWVRFLAEADTQAYPLRMVPRPR